MNFRLIVWMCLLLFGLLLGLPLDHTTLFWTGVLSIWLIAGLKN